MDGFRRRGDAVFSIDHVVLAVSDLDEAAERLHRQHGLASVPGGRHAKWGTGNRIVPLGHDYVELIAVVDPDVGRSTELGRTLLALTADGRDRWFAVCLADSELESTATRLGLEVEAGARTRPDGAELRWYGAGIDDDSREAWLPFFIAWDGPPELHPGRTPIAHDVAVTGIGSVEIAGDATRLRTWLGSDGDALPIRVLEGDPGIHAVELATPSRISLRL